MEQNLNFKPLIKSPYYQTVMGTAIDFEPDLKSMTHYVKLPDRDLMAVEISKPKGWNEEDGIILLLHGLCGSHKSHYMKRIARRFYKKGHLVARINLRNCGSGRGLSRGIYHHGSSHDVKEVLENLRLHYPKAPKILVGFSLGANITLKLAGELGIRGLEYLKGCIAVSPPAELLESTKLFSNPKNQIYANYFLKILRNEVDFLHQHFKDLPPHNLPRELTITDFDEIYVAPRAKFASALEYYYYCSSKRVIPNIQIPAHILLAKDDPIINHNSLDDLLLPDNVKIFKTDHGGHIGFLGRNIFKEFRWMDNLVVKWAQKMLNS